MTDYKKLYEEEKSKSHIWMIVSIVSILIGVVLLIIVGYLAMTRHPIPKCDCYISQKDLDGVGIASATLNNFKHKISTLSHFETDCNPLAVTPVCNQTSSGFKKSCPNNGLQKSLKQQGRNLQGIPGLSKGAPRKLSIKKEPVFQRQIRSERPSSMPQLENY